MSIPLDMYTYVHLSTCLYTYMYAYMHLCIPSGSRIKVGGFLSLAHPATTRDGPRGDGVGDMNPP